MPRQHDMVLAESAAPGTEEWLCHECGRRILLRWPPRFELVVLFPGDEEAIHSGAKGVRMGSAEVTHWPAEIADDARQWLWNNGIDWDGLAS